VPVNVPDEDMFPVVLRLDPVAAPIFGVTRVGEVFITNVDPVPVCDATLVALPTLMIGPVRLAFVVTVDALPTKSAVIVPAVKLPLASLLTIVLAEFVEVAAFASNSAL
jgi:hypothetical protein